MITDAMVLNEVREGWEFVRESRNLIVGNCNVATFTVGFNQAGIRNLCFNLLLASAFSVLEEVLRQVRTEGKFVSKKDQLAYLMSSSRGTLPWSNYDFIDKARNERNLSVHQRKYMSHEQCRDYIAGIERELVAWGVLSSGKPELWHW